MNLPNITASIPLEVQTLAAFIRPLYTEVHGQNLPKEYIAGHCVVRYEDDDNYSETSATDVFDRRYQILSFSENEFRGLQQLDALQQAFTGVHSLQLLGSSRYMRIGTLLPSRPFLTEDKKTYATISVLHVQVRQRHEPRKYPPIGGIIINPGGPDEIVIGDDCRAKGGQVNG